MGVAFSFNLASSEAVKRARIEILMAYGYKQPPKVSGTSSYLCPRLTVDLYETRRTLLKNIKRAVQSGNTAAAVCKAASGRHSKKFIVSPNGSGGLRLTDVTIEKGE